MDAQIDLYKREISLYIKNEDYQGALPYYEKLLNVKESMSLYLGKGIACFKVQAYREAELSLQRSLNLHEEKDSEEDLFAILSYKAQAKHHQQRTSEAIEDLEYFLTSFSAQYQSKTAALIKSLQQETTDSTEREEFFKLYRENMEVHPGDYWYLVSSAWIERWLSYVGFTDKTGYEELPLPAARTISNRHPGPIDNSDLIDLSSDISVKDENYATSEIKVRNGLVENMHYFLLPEIAYQYLQTRYSCENPIKRATIEITESMFQVEVYLKYLKVAFPSLSLNIQSIQLSRKTTVSTLKQKMTRVFDCSVPCKVWKVSLNDIFMERLQIITCTNAPVYLEGGSIIDDNLCVDDAEIGVNDIVLMEPMRSGEFYLSDNKELAENRCTFCQQAERLRFTCGRCGVTKYCSKNCRRRHEPEHKSKCVRQKKMSIFSCFCAAPEIYSDEDEDEMVPRRTISSQSRFGLAGLQNLGNTCYMNSALQCLSHTSELTDYFLSNTFFSHLNKTNPFGTKGRLALSYSELLDNLWNGSQASFAPWKIKKVISTFASQFSGYQQHDAHDLLCFVMDRLHEDLNKVKNKPYFEEALKNEENLAELSWERHLARNQSIIVDLFHGQYKSTIYCPSCGNYSYTYDPFDNLTLPIPSGRNIAMSVYFIYKDGRKTPKNLRCDGKYRTLRDFGKDIQKHLEVEEFTFVHVSNNSVKCILKDSISVEDASSFVLFAYEGSAGPFVQVVITKESYQKRNVAYPRLISITEETTFKDLHLQVFEKVKGFVDSYKDSKQELELQYETHMKSPKYKLLFQSDRVHPCSYCKESSCLGCAVPFSDSLVSEIKNELVTIELRWKPHQSSSNIEDMNKCLEEDRLTKSKQVEPIDISDCFELFGQTEQLDRMNAWYCSTCKTHIEATKKLEIYKVPKVLIIILKRFRTHGFYREKNSTPVNFPIEGFDLSPYVIGPQDSAVYDLYAMANHFGSLGGGHYTATCFNKMRGKWVEFNDSQLSESSNIWKSSSYILFYRLREEFSH